MDIDVPRILSEATDMQLKPSSMLLTPVKEDNIGSGSRTPQQRSSMFQIVETITLEEDFARSIPSGEATSDNNSSIVSTSGLITEIKPI